MFAGCMHLSVLSLGLVYRGLTVSFQLDFKHFCLIQVLQRVVVWRNYLFICTSLPETLLFKGDITIGSNVCKDSSLPPVIQCFPTWHLVGLQDSPEKKCHHFNCQAMPPPPKKSIVFSFFCSRKPGLVQAWWPLPSQTKGSRWAQARSYLKKLRSPCEPPFLLISYVPTNRGFL